MWYTTHTVLWAVMKHVFTSNIKTTRAIYLKTWELDYFGTGLNVRYKTQYEKI